MRSAQFKLRFWMLEIPVWLLGLLWAMSAGADNLHLEPLNQGFNKVLQSSQTQLVQDPLGGAARARMQAAYGRLPLGFESNQGQADPSIRFLSRSPGAGLFFKNNEVVLQTQVLRSPVAPPSSNNTDAGEQTRIHLQWLGANPNAVVVGEDPMARKSHYLAGDSSSWRINVPNYSRLRYKAVYPGIDLVFYGNPEFLVYVFVLATGANASAIVLRF